jgi:hypothetical protein
MLLRGRRMHHDPHGWTAGAARERDKAQGLQLTQGALDRAAVQAAELGKAPNGGPRTARPIRVRHDCQQDLRGSAACGGETAVQQDPKLGASHGSTIHRVEVTPKGPVG